MKRRGVSNRGFTLIELMITVAIVGVLAAIAIPQYTRYQLRSKRAEAHTNIGGIKTSQEGFRAENDNYAHVTNVNPTPPPEIFKVNWEVRSCPAGCGRNASASCSEFSCIGFEPAGPVYFRYESHHRAAASGTSPEYCVAAVADLDADGLFSEFEFQSSYDALVDTGVVNCPLATTGRCSGQLTFPDQIANCAPSDF